MFQREARLQRNADSALEDLEDMVDTAALASVDMGALASVDMGALDMGDMVQALATAMDSVMDSHTLA